jgi:hypothetical protein
MCTFCQLRRNGLIHKGCPICRGRGGNGRTAHGDIGQWTIVGAPVPEGKQRRFYNVATIASITGYTRAQLWRNICRVRAAGAVPLYCDTDCLVVSGSGDDGFLLSDRLGDWSLEGRFSRGGFAGKKLYAWEHGGLSTKPAGTWKIASKGCRLTAPEIMRVSGGHVVEYVPAAPTLGVGKAPVFRRRRIQNTAG